MIPQGGEIKIPSVIQSMQTTTTNKQTNNNNKQQRDRNTALRLILRAPRHQHRTSLLQQLYWFSVSERFKYKTACMCNYNAIIRSVPSSLSELLHLYIPFPLSPSDTRMFKLHRFNRKTLMDLPLSHTSVPTFGTIKTPGTQLLSLPSKTNSRYFSSPNVLV